MGGILAAPTSSPIIKNCRGEILLARFSLIEEIADTL
jgi:hypothetical protein